MIKKLWQYYKVSFNFRTYCLF